MTSFSRPHFLHSLIILLICLTAGSAQAQLEWSDQFAGFGIRGYTSGVISWNGNLVFGGVITSQGSIECDNVVRFDGAEWHEMGSPGFFEFTTLGIFQDDLYAHGYWANFSLPDYLVRWNGTAWEVAADVPDGVVLTSMVAFQGQLIIAGTGGYLRGFDGTNLNDLGNNFDYGTLRSLVVLNGELYVGGDFDQLEGGTPANGLAKWDGITWLPVDGRSAPGSALVQGIHGGSESVRELMVHQGRLVVAGNFDHAGDLPANNIAILDPATQLWSSLGDGLGLNVYALASNGSLLFAGGDFTEVDGQPISRLAAWDGATWNSVATSIEGSVYGLTFNGNTLVLAGNFHTINGAQAPKVAFWDGSQFSTSSGPSGLGFDVGPSRLLPYDGSFIAAGGFMYGGTTRLNNIGQWTGSGWTDLDGGLDGRVVGALLHEGGIVVIGEFTSAGGQPIPYLARWDGAAWSALGDPLPGQPSALTVHNGQIHVGGNPPEFIPPYLKRYDPATGWHDVALQPGVTYVDALGSYQGNLYIGGTINTFYGPADPIAYHDGAEWHPVVQYGDASGARISRFVEFDGILHLVGNFQTVNGQWANSQVFQWDGNQISPLLPQSGLININRSSALVRFEGATYLGAWREYNGETIFRHEPGAPDWELVNGGLNNNVWDLLEFDGRLLMAGRFDRAIPADGPSISAWGFTWLDPSPSGTPETLPPLARLQPLQPNPFNPATVILFDIPDGGATGSLAVYDLKGRLVRMLHAGSFVAGPHETLWNGRDDAGQDQASGVYLVRLATESGVKIQKGMLVR